MSKYDEFLEDKDLDKVEEEQSNNQEEEDDDDDFDMSSPEHQMEEEL